MIPRTIKHVLPQPTIPEKPDTFQAPVLKAPWWWLLLAFTLGLFCVLNTSQQIPTLMGFGPLPKWLDAHAVLSALDAQRAGLNVYDTNPLDILGRVHAYSSLWLKLGYLGLGRPDVNGFAYFSLGCFLLPVLTTFRPANRTEFLWLTTFLISSGVLLALYRANNDLIIFGLMACMLLCFQHRSLWVKCAAPLILCLAAGLKYYPLIAACVFFTEPERRTRHLLLALTAAGLFLTAFSIRENFTRMGNMHTIPGVAYSFGFKTPLQLLGLSDKTALLLSLLTGSTVALSAFLAKPNKDWLASLAPDWRYRSFLVASALLAGCYWIEANWAYRLIYLAGMLPFLVAAPAMEMAPRWFGQILTPLKVLVVLTMIQGTLAAILTTSLIRFGAEGFAMNLWTASNILLHSVHLPLAGIATFLVALPIAANIRSLFHT